MNSASTHKNPDFWIFGLFFFLYFFIMATCFPFLPVWLSDVVGLSKTDTGIVFSCLSLFAISFQPLLGVISDRLGLKKNLIWSISLLLVFFAPFFLYVFAPLLRFNIWAGALTGGVFIGFVFSAGAGAIEAYIERVSRSRGFEYGKARMFGCLGWALCAAMAGMLFNVDPSLVFWMGSGSALLLLLLLFLARPSTSQTAMVMNTLGANSSLISTRMVFSLFRMRQMWMFVLYTIGVACVYDVFDQQFATFFRSFFDTPQAGIKAFGFATTAGEICNAIIMFCTPWIIHRIGAKNTLLVAGGIMTIRITGSAFATTASEVVVTGRRCDIHPSFCQSLSHLNITLSLTPFSRAIWTTQAPGCDASSTIRSLNSFEYFLRGSFRQSCNSILRCPSVSDGRLSYQFLSNGYIRRSVYAYDTTGRMPINDRKHAKS